MAASVVVLLCNLHQFGAQRKLDDRLEVAFQRYDNWCKANSKTTAVRGFSKDDFAMGKKL